MSGRETSVHGTGSIFPVNQKLVAVGSPCRMKVELGEMEASIADCEVPGFFRKFGFRGLSGRMVPRHFFPATS